jgi:hypothetical protein
VFPILRVSNCLLFQSYAHADQADAESLVVRLKQNFDASVSIRCMVWDDRQILIGSNWEESIKQVMAHADYGLLLVSPASMASNFIQRIEIPSLLASSKLLLVGLRPVDFRTQLPPALQDLQVFLHKTAKGNELFYTECQTGPQKDAFALGLYKALRARLSFDMT